MPPVDRTFRRSVRRVRTDPVLVASRPSCPTGRLVVPLLSSSRSGRFVHRSSGRSVAVRCFRAVHVLSSWPHGLHVHRSIGRSAGRFVAFGPLLSCGLAAFCPGALAAFSSCGLAAFLPCGLAAFCPGGPRGLLAPRPGLAPSRPLRLSSVRLGRSRRFCPCRPVLVESRLVVAPRSGRVWLLSRPAPVGSRPRVSAFVALLPSVPASPSSLLSPGSVASRSRRRALPSRLALAPRPRVSPPLGLALAPRPRVSPPLGLTLGSRPRVSPSRLALASRPRWVSPSGLDLVSPSRLAPATSRSALPCLALVVPPSSPSGLAFRLASVVALLFGRCPAFRSSPCLPVVALLLVLPCRLLLPRLSAPRR